MYIQWLLSDEYFPYQVALLFQNILRKVSQDIQCWTPLSVGYFYVWLTSFRTELCS